MGKKKRKQGEERLEFLKGLANELGFRVQEFSPIHVRVFGSTTVDYWPTTSRAWIVGGVRKAEHVTPLNVIEMARWRGWIESWSSSKRRQCSTSSPS
jgi:hypothetical protein